MSTKPAVLKAGIMAELITWIERRRHDNWGAEWCCKGVGCVPIPQRRALQVRHRLSRENGIMHLKCCCFVCKLLPAAVFIVFLKTCEKM